MDTGIITGTLVKGPEGEILSFGNDDNRRNFMLEIVEGPKEKQQEIVDLIYSQTQRIILLVRERLERERPIETQITLSAEGEESHDNI